MEAAYKPPPLNGRSRSKRNLKSRPPCFQLEEERVSRKKRKKIVVLPEAIIHHEILTRLPTKYILGCRLVCKSWYSLFSDPSFAKLHLTRQHSRCEPEEDVIIARKRAFVYHGISIISRTQEIPAPFVPEVLCPVILGSINGLVCLCCSDGKQLFSLWNPAIAQVKIFNLPSHHSTDTRICRHSVGGFSWDPVRNDYKLVLVCYECQTFSPSCFLLYSSNSATWTQVPLVSTHPVLPNASVFGLKDAIGGHAPTRPPSALVKGIPYWTYSHYLQLPGKKLRRKFITTFKFVANNNEFRLLPDLNTSKTRGKRFNIVNIKDSLFGMAYKERCQHSNVDFYSLDDEESPSGVWSKMYSIGPIDLSAPYWGLSQGFKNGGEILIFKAPVFSFYDPETKDTKDIIKSNCGLGSSRIFSYTPSLVRVQGMELMKQELSTPFLTYI